MVGSAQVEILPEEQEEPLDAMRPGPLPGLRAEAAERLAAHRLRRAKPAAGAAEPERDLRGGSSRVDSGRGSGRGQVAAAVAERFAHTPSYRAMLAEQARKAMEQAAAVAEVALRNAEAVHAAQSELLVELQKWTEPVAFSARTAEVVASEAAQGAVADAMGHAVERAPGSPGMTHVKEVSTAGLTVRLYEDAGSAALPGRRDVTGNVQARNNRGELAPPDEQEARELDELDSEIAFRQAPVFEAYAPQEPAVPIPGNLLEFPRQLVAAKKSRPRLAEGPLLLEEAERNPQLRIFEVEPVATVAELSPAAMEWSSIWLDAHTVTEIVEDPDGPLTSVLASLLPPQVAPMHLRVMAAVVDGLLVLGGFVLFSAAAAYVAGSVPTGALAGIVAGGALALLYLAYQALFFWLSDSTPGMRYARIGLCTFSDENPSRSAMRRRILAQLVAICPLGIGILWMLLDDDKLGWHDRISRMYQRAY
jgi:uncharacterized RDD family membrane protein YckC